jgi:hypothetical protein
MPLNFSDFCTIIKIEAKEIKNIFKNYVTISKSSTIIITVGRGDNNAHTSKPPAREKGIPLHDNIRK